ncbi:nitroreductase family protein [Aquicoccus porphyridii]|uniref:Nitroreductase family protein n=1 Tax=Aquicoccus porphyridii TaxID=1852029 RepID=A0A5A9ZJY5_9RHOB|nr:nitroreductase family protein [Aquicoccus porphyridii]KAA0917623.1 nitroreductase family protein [Aquicoccus porphyridii]RAI55697.1 nitroreductase family protein [Rhodobacteraceae bacterium AsT-22]
MAEDYTPLPLPDWVDRSDEEIAARADAFRAEMARRHTIRDFSTRPVARAVIEDCIATAGLAPSGANHQPWHFVAIADPGVKAKIRAAAEEEEARFYAGGAGDEWLAALEPIGTGVSKPHLELAPWLIVVFAQRWGERSDGTRFKHYYVPESVGIASGFLITALHRAGLAALTHTPNPMKFLTEICERPAHEKPVMIVAVGHPANDATVPEKALRKKPLSDISTFMET